MPDAPRWSKADTHCPACERPLEDGICSQCDCVSAADLMLSLRATVEAQGKVIGRYKAGWVATSNGWWHHARKGVGPELMDPAEQVVLYGEVVDDG